MVTALIVDMEDDNVTRITTQAIISHITATILEKERSDKARFQSKLERIQTDMLTMRQYYPPRLSLFRVMAVKLMTCRIRQVNR